MSEPAVFLDRDGTIMEEVGFCGDPAGVCLIPGAGDAIQRLRARGFRIVIVTNQSGIGRGYYSVEDFERVQAELFHQLGGAELIDATYYSPDIPGTEPSRRKPSPDMLHEAARDLDLDLTRSYIVGDREGDIGAGHNAGCRSILVLSGEVRDPKDTRADAVASTIVGAADWILAHHRIREAGFDIESLLPVGEGDDSTAYLLNRDQICRVPKHERALNNLLKESLLLPSLAPLLPLTVPQPVYAAIAEFSMHPIVNGTPFTLDDYRALESVDQHACLIQIADFLQALHSARPAAAASILETADHKYPGQPVLLHGDLSPDHILWDPQAKRITGIIDFGDMQFGDPAWDFIYFWEDYNEAFLQDLIRVGGFDPDIANRSRRLLDAVNR